MLDHYLAARDYNKIVMGFVNVYFLHGRWHWIQLAFLLKVDIEISDFTFTVPDIKSVAFVEHFDGIGDHSCAGNFRLGDFVVVEDLFDSARFGTEDCVVEFPENEETTVFGVEEKIHKFVIPLENFRLAIQG